MNSGNAEQTEHRTVRGLLQGDGSRPAEGRGMVCSFSSWFRPSQLWSEKKNEGYRVHSLRISEEILGCVTNFVFLEKNDFFLVRITI